MNNLQASQSFTTDVASNKLTLDLKTSTAISGRNAPGPLTIGYDADTNSYSIATPSQTVMFSPSDVVDSDDVQTMYQKRGDTDRNYLTLVKAPIRVTPSRNMSRSVSFSTTC